MDRQYDEHERAVIYQGANLQKKAAQTLLGICSGLIADNDLNESEFLYLRHWLMENRDYLQAWPGTFLRAKIDHIMEDGIITAEELCHFKDVLSDLIGGKFSDMGTTRSLATTLPLCNVNEVLFEGSRFCFTGTFLFGTRNLCQAAVERLGGLCQPGVNKQLNYLVIGNIGSEAWITSSYGRKIEKAVQQRQSGLGTIIVNEEIWCASLN